mmetsp:Transcript_109045/g.326152  ORF Transcript_109045/g.326152 Transcript_109045/m.326152 type:complete len:250 (+) Transcript_109045:203-952(+)
MSMYAAHALGSGPAMLRVRFSGSSGRSRMAIFAPVIAWISLVPAPPRPMRPPTRWSGTTQLSAKPRESSITYGGNPCATRIMMSMPEPSAMGMPPRPSITPALPPPPPCEEAPAAWKLPVVAAHVGNQGSVFSAWTRLFTSSITCSIASVVPAMVRSCSNPGPLPMSLPLTEIFAPLSSRICLMVAPPLPMMPLTAERGTRIFTLRLPSSEASLLRDNSAILMRTCLNTSLSDSSCSAWAVNTRQSVCM